VILTFVVLESESPQSSHLYTFFTGPSASFLSNPLTFTKIFLALSPVVHSWMTHGYIYNWIPVFIQKFMPSSAIFPVLETSPKILPGSQWYPLPSECPFTDVDSPFFGPFPFSFFRTLFFSPCLASSSLVREARSKMEIPSEPPQCYLPVQ